MKKVAKVSKKKKTNNVPPSCRPIHGMPAWKYYRLRKLGRIDENGKPIKNGETKTKKKK